jgi:hypothetical protein
MWHCVIISLSRLGCDTLSLLVSPDVSEERIAFLFKGWEVQVTTEDDGMASFRMVGEHQTAN